MNRRLVLVYWCALTAAHFIVDMAPGIFPSLLPKLMEQFNTKLLGVAALGTVFSLSSDFGQPVVGAAGDRWGLEHVLVWVPTVVVVAAVPAFVLELGMQRDQRRVAAAARAAGAA